MHRALALAETVRGRTSPNPAVGAVILDAGRQPGRRGRDRSRPAARTPRSSRSPRPATRARGAPRVVTLEPCAHTGRTGPCAEALDRRRRRPGRLRRRRPEPRGRRRRRRGCGRPASRSWPASLSDAAAGGALRPVAARDAHRRPFVTWKFAAHAGRAGRRRRRHARGGSPRPRRAADVHTLRAVVDAIVVGSGTVLADDPQLTVRDADGDLAEHQPLRVVLDRRHRVPQHARVLDDARRDAGARHRGAALRAEGPVRPRRAPRAARGRPDAGRGVRRGAVRRRGRRLPRAEAARRRPAGARRRRHRHHRRRRHAGDRRGRPARRRRQDRRPAASGREEESSACSPGSSRSSARSSRSSARGDSAVLHVAAARDRRRPRRTARRSRSTASASPSSAGPTAPAPHRRVDFDVMAETLERSVIGALRPGDAVNLERAVTRRRRLDGHIVQGHVDGTGVDRVPHARRRLGDRALRRCPPSSPATSPRRARSRSTGSR